MLGQIMVAAGLLLMLFNVYMAVAFIKNQVDVIAGKKAIIPSIVVLSFIIFFAIVYAIILFQNFDQITIGVILLSGSAFVTGVLVWIKHLVGSIKNTTLGMASTLSTVIEARDPSLTGHSRHVQALTKLLYEYLPDYMRHQLSLTNLEYAALFHDLGKLGVPESILNKAGVLTPDEWDVMRQHPETGAQILEPVESFAEIENWIRYHHERIDGKGYYGLPGEDMPLGARVIAVTDAFSAMYMARPYKDGSSFDECIDEIRRGAGKQFDAEVVEAFCSIPRARVVQCNKELLDKRR